MITHIYRVLPKLTTVPFQLFLKLREVLIRVLKDPDVKYRISDIEITLPLSHGLPIYRKLHPRYDQLPVRLAAFLRTNEGHIRCIDVGANVGDTIAVMNVLESDVILAIEPSPFYSRFLHQNWGDNAQVSIRKFLVSDYNASSRFQSTEVGGTGNFQEATSEGEMFEVVTLDSLVENGSLPDLLNLVKIDTDGHDFKVIKGAANLMRKFQPFLLFECGHFNNPNFYQDVADVLAQLKESGYPELMVYDNLGFLMARMNPENPTEWKNLLFYILNHGISYVDILAVPPKWTAVFRSQEIQFHASAMTDQEKACLNNMSFHENDRIPMAPN